MAHDAVTDSISAAVAAVEDRPESVKVTVAGAAAAAAMPAPGVPPVTLARDISILWWVLVGGLVLILLGSLVGIIVTVADGKTSTSPDVIVTVFSSVLTGLIGLFVTSPQQTK
jgi:hypothetical protein